MKYQLVSPNPPRSYWATPSLLMLAVSAMAATYPSAVQKDNPAGYYRLNDSAARPEESANSGSIGSAGNGVSHNVKSMSGAIVGSPNKAAYFDSTAQTVIPWNADLNPNESTSFTIEAWFCPTSDKVAGDFVGPAPIMNRYSYAGANRQGWVYFQRNPDSRIYKNGQTDVGWNFRTYRGAGGSTGINLTSKVPYKLGQWQHVVTVWEAETQTAIMYVDGEEAARQTWNTADPGYVANTDDHDPAQAVRGAAGLSIGSYNNTEPGSNPFRGGVDEVALFSKALTPEQVKAHYENAKNPDRTVSYDALVKSDGPVGYWRLDDSPAGADVSVNMGLLQSAGHGVNTSEMQRTSRGALAGSNDGAMSFHNRNGSATTDLPYDAAMNPTADKPFTVEAWFRPTSDRQNPGASPINNRYVKVNRTGWVIFQRAPNSSYSGVPGYEGVGWNFRMYTGAGGNSKDIVSNVPYVVGEWQHVVVTWDGVSTGTMYINGVEAASNVAMAYTANENPPGTGDPADAADLAIGSYNRASGLGSNPFEGDVDDFAFYNVQLTPDQILAHYNAGVDPSQSETYPNLVLTAPYELALTAEVPAPAQALQPITYLRFGEKAASPAVNSGSAGENADGAVIGGTPLSAAGPQSPAYPGFEDNNQAIDSAVKSWVSLDNPLALNLAGEVSVEAWVRPAATQGERARIVSHGPPTISSYPAVPERKDAILSGNELSLEIRGNGAEYFFGASDGIDTFGVAAQVPGEDLGSDAWVHLVGVRKGSEWLLYRNGTLLSSAPSEAGALTVENGGWSIGSTGNGWGDNFIGGIDEVAIYGTGLTSEQVAAHYAAATSTGGSLSIARAGNKVTLTWSGGVLQQSATVTGGYSDVTGAASPLEIASPKETRFYRLKP